MTTNTHALEDFFTETEVKAVIGAASMARVTGSRGITDRTEVRNQDGTLQVVDEVTVAAIEVDRHFGPAYRVTTHQNMVIVLRSAPGRFKSHARPEPRPQGFPW